VRFILIASLLLAGCTSSTIEHYVFPERAALGLPYSDAVRAGDLLFLAGTVGAAPGTRQVVPGGIEAETRQALANIKANLDAHGSSVDRVVKCTVLLADINEFEAMNKVYREFFSGPKPARTTFAVAALPLGARIEIDCIAVSHRR
jgi:2-iminobutanoate/2-iminopropanoate deaminase